jgi:hypothetical protein
VTTVAPAVVLNVQDDLFLWSSYLEHTACKLVARPPSPCTPEERFRQSHRVANCCAIHTHEGPAFLGQIKCHSTKFM